VQKIISSFEIKKPQGEIGQPRVNSSSCNNGYKKGVYDAQRDLQGLNGHGYDPYVHRGDLNFQNCYGKGYDASWSASPKLPSPSQAQAPSTCESKIFPGIGEIDDPSGGHGLRIRVDVTGSENGSHPARITITGPGGESLCNNFELTAAGYSKIFYFNEGLINDGEPFKACVILLDANSIKCVTGVNHLGRHSESVTLKTPNVRNS
jgi:hypothetical protein